MRNGLYKNGYSFLWVKTLLIRTKINAQFYSVSMTTYYSILNKWFLTAKPALSKSQNSPYNLRYDETEAFKYYPKFYF